MYGKLSIGSTEVEIKKLSIILEVGCTRLHEKVTASY